jgi:hypothetical protein
LIVSFDRGVEAQPRRRSVRAISTGAREAKLQQRPHDDSNRLLLIEKVAAEPCTAVLVSTNDEGWVGRTQELSAMVVVQSGVAGKQATIATHQSIILVSTHCVRGQHSGGLGTAALGQFGIASFDFYMRVYTLDADGQNVCNLCTTDVSGIV